MSNKMIISIYHGGIAMLGVLSCIYRYFFKMSDRALLEMLLLCMGSDIVFGLLKAAKKGGTQFCYYASWTDTQSRRDTYHSTAR